MKNFKKIFAKIPFLITIINSLIGNFIFLFASVFLGTMLNKNEKFCHLVNDFCSVNFWGIDGFSGMIPITVFIVFLGSGLCHLLFNSFYILSSERLIERNKVIWLRFLIIFNFVNFFILFFFLRSLWIFAVGSA